MINTFQKKYIKPVLIERKQVNKKIESNPNLTLPHLNSHKSNYNMNSIKYIHPITIIIIMIIIIIVVIIIILFT